MTNNHNEAELLQEAVSKIIQLQSTKGSLEKLKLMRECSTNAYFGKLLFYALNPFNTYKISEATMRKYMGVNPDLTTTMCDIFTVCDELANRKALDESMVYQVCAFLQCVESEAERELYIQLLAKTLRLGVTAKSVNKAIPGLIPEWEVQQAYPIEKYPVKDGTPFFLTQKLNGIRATFYRDELYARSGVPIDWLDHITRILRQKSLEGLVFDGELTLRNRVRDGLSDNEAFRLATGIINSGNPDKTDICYTIFDVIAENSFVSDDCAVNYSERRSQLEKIKEAFRYTEFVSILPCLYSGSDVSVIETKLNEAVLQDQEGLMVNLDVPYKRKRHKGILKVKRFYTMDLEIVDVEEGSGRLQGKLGAFVLSFNGNLVRVGSGFTDEERELFWSQRAELIGVLCEVKYKEVSSDKKTGAQSLQFPVFVTLRTDKTNESFM